MSSSAVTEPGRATRAWRWLNRHPRVVGGFLLVCGLIEAGEVVVDGRPERLTFAVMTIAAGVVSVVRERPRVTDTAWIVPNRWAGGRHVPAGEIRHVEVPASVWSTAGTTLVLTTDERVPLAGVDRLLAVDLAGRLQVNVARV